MNVQVASANPVISSPSRNRVLLIDDNASIHGDFRKVLCSDVRDEAQAALAQLESDLFGETKADASRPDFEIDSAYQGKEGVEMARVAREQGRPYAMAFVDMRMPPGWDGLKTIEQLWLVDPDVHVVICSAHTDYDWSEVVERLKHSDKLLVLRKPAEPIEVLQCATALTRKWHNERLMRDHMVQLEQVINVRTRGLEAATRQLRHLATHDALTGLPNRVLLDDRVTQAMAHADRDGRSFALMVCDLDRFKLVNDSLGHAAGDDLLQEVAHRLSGLVRATDTVARIGGDEFVLLITTIDHADDAKRLAGRAVEVLQEPVRIAEVDVHTSPSIGIAFYPSDGKSIESLMAHADAAMYCAKQRGRGCVQCFEGDMSAGIDNRVQLESDLHQAIALKQFELYYQPKVHTNSGVVRSAEALIRWMHPERGLIAPDGFIPLAEDCGLIGAIGEWVVHEACRQARAWVDGGLTPMRVSVNLSPSQFRGSGLIHSIRRALDEAGLDPQYLEVELTESAVMSDPEESIAILEQLSAMGVLVSVDDFGTGYSSMSYSAAAADRQAQDRPRLHQRDREPAGGCLDRARDRVARAQPAAEGRCGGRRDTGATRFLEGRRLRRVPGLSLQPAFALTRIRAGGSRKGRANRHIDAGRRESHP